MSAEPCLQHQCSYRCANCIAKCMVHLSSSAHAVHCCSECFIVARRKIVWPRIRMGMSVIYTGMTNLPGTTSLLASGLEFHAVITEVLKKDVNLQVFLRDRIVPRYNVEHSALGSGETFRLVDVDDAAFEHWRTTGEIR